MKIIQSFWAAQQDVTTNSFGWVSPKFHAISWALSCLQLSKFYDVELYTDQLGFDLLINKLELPYKKVNTILDELNDYHKDFWALPKIKAYMLQKEPFLHIDGDVFIWEKFSDQLMEAPLISQNLEITTEYYHEMWKEIYPNLHFIPKEIEGYVNNTNNFACNMGIFGGNDVVFLNQYAIKSFDFAHKNRKLSDKINGGNFNIFFEQVLFYEMMYLEKKSCDYHIDEVSEDNRYVGFGNFDEVPNRRTYLHLLGYYKRIYPVCKMMENYFMSYYPDYFKNIVALFPEDYDYFSKEDIDFNFTLEDNEKHSNVFLKSIQDNLPQNVDSLFLLRRDITCIRLHEFLYHEINENNNFIIKKIDGNEIVDSTIEEEKILLIHELNNEYTEIPLDEIDLIILEKIKAGIHYQSLKTEMLDLLEEDALEMKDHFIDMLNTRLNYYLKHKILVVYS